MQYTYFSLKKYFWGTVDRGNSDTTQLVLIFNKKIVIYLIIK